MRDAVGRAPNVGGCDDNGRMTTNEATARIPSLRMNDGRRIPQVGLGVYKVDAEQTAEVVATALGLGYRHVDTATLYGNERGVGDGIRRSGLDPDDVFVTTKVWHDDHGFDETLRAFDRSIAELGLDAVDLYLIHWPAPSLDRYVDSWRALIRLRDEGRARSIGVSNFKPHHIERLRDETGQLPAVDQVELHPRYPQAATNAFLAEHGIVTEAWAPLGRGTVLADDALGRVAAKHGVTAAQVVLRWHLEAGRVVIPKSVHRARMAENLDVLGFELDADDRAAIARLDTNAPTGKDPDVFPGQSQA